MSNATNESMSTLLTTPIMSS